MRHTLTGVCDPLSLLSVHKLEPRLLCIASRSWPGAMGSYAKCALKDVAAPPTEQRTYCAHVRPVPTPRAQPSCW